MRKFLAFSAALLASTPGAATVFYDFGTLSGNFAATFTVDDFLTGAGFLSPSDLDSCTLPAGNVCLGVAFDDGGGLLDQLGLKLDSNGFITTLDFAFPNEAFLSPGTYLSTSTHGSLTVREANSAVPEPVTWAMMLLGFGAIGLAMRRRKQTELTFRQAA